MQYQRQILLSTDPVPRASIILLSVFGHVVALALIIVIRHSAGPHIVPEQYTMVQAISAGGSLPFTPPSSKPQPSLLHTRKSKKHARVPEPLTDSDGTGLQALRGRAKAATAGLMADFKFRQVYGFSPGDYQLAIQTYGVIPAISAAELPSRYEQYLIVEVTIDVDGRVADARLVTGKSSSKIEQKLLSAIREFKYIPAKRDGSPIPCQVDIVVHIPT